MDKFFLSLFKKLKEPSGAAPEGSLKLTAAAGNAAAFIKYSVLKALSDHTLC